MFRVFDDGVGFRYEWPEQPNLKNLVIKTSSPSSRSPKIGRVWWIPAYEPEHYEYLYKNDESQRAQKGPHAGHVRNSPTAST